MTLGVVLAIGCGPTVVQDGGSDNDGGQTTTAGMTVTPDPTAPPLPGTTTLPSGDVTTQSSDDGELFIPEYDIGGNFECDIFAQDCPDGEKCAPWANDGGTSWNATRCVPIAQDPGAPGEPCMVESNGLHGIDDCELGAVCWYVNSETLEGTCLALCTGDPSNPHCEDPNSTCHITSDGPIFCIPRCHPVAQDCSEGFACYPRLDEFTCAPDASGDMGAAGDPCEFINVCDPGTFCASADSVPDCPGALGCCSPFCELGDPMPPCLPGQVCTPYYEEGSAPRGLEQIGYCALPA
ncbi:MAG: ribulose phosphate epimerase [Myxococcota bacterium]